MQFAMIGLGRMGTALAQKAREAGHEPVGWDPDNEARRRVDEIGIPTVESLTDIVAAIEPPRLALMYVPHGPPVDANLDVLTPLLATGDVVADGGNSHWEDSRRRHERLAADGVRFLDIGTSGGIGLAPGWEGAAFMVGGDRDAFQLVEPVLRSMAVDDRAVHYVGPASTGHFVKLVHNAIEFGMLQAIGEGFELVVRSPHDIDVAALFEHWNHGTVIRSWLVELMANALREHPSLDALSTYVEDTGEVKWVVNWATDQDIPAPVTALSQQLLMAYRDTGSPMAKAVALLRNQFGGHPLHPSKVTDDRDGSPPVGPSGT